MANESVKQSLKDQASMANNQLNQLQQENAEILGAMYVAFCVDADGNVLPKVKPTDGFNYNLYMLAKDEELGELRIITPGGVYTRGVEGEYRSDDLVHFPFASVELSDQLRLMEIIQEGHFLPLDEDDDDPELEGDEDEEEDDDDDSW